MKIRNVGIKFVFRHYWEKKDRTWMIQTEWNEKRVGFFWRKNLAVGSRIKGKGAFKHENLVPCYLFGIELGWMKGWVEFEFGKVLSFKVD